MSISYASQKQTTEFIAQVVRALPSLDPDIMQGWIENPKSLREELAGVLCPPKVTIPIWTTLTLGTLKNADTACRCLKEVGCSIHRFGEGVIDRVDFSESEFKVKLVRVTPRELGLNDYALTHEVYDAAERHNLVRCPGEVGVQLCLVYCPTTNDSINIAMHGVWISEILGPVQFYIHSSQKQCVLGGISADKKHRIDEHFIFVDPR